MHLRTLACVSVSWLAVGCSAPEGPLTFDSGHPLGGGGPASDSGLESDAGLSLDAGAPDAGATPDAGAPDAGTPDAGTPDAGTPDAGTPDAGTPDAGTPDAGDQIALSGNKILLNNAEFFSRGLVIEGLLLPLADVNQCVSDYSVDGGDPKILKYCARHLDSRDYLAGRGVFSGGNDALSLGIKNWNMNTVRFNVLQVALDPSSQYFSISYLEEIRAAVRLARSKGLVVILAIFDSPANDDAYFKNRYPKLSLDDAVTLAAAKTLAGEFGRDQGVILELLNEPYLAKTPLDVRWALWRDGGSVTYGPFAGHRFVGVNAIIREVRSLGAANAIIVQAPSATFEKFPGGVVDPLNKVIYSAHAFLVAGDDAEVNWQFLFGDIAKSAPFIMTAWGVDSDSTPPSPNQWCAVRGPDMAQKYLNYLQAFTDGVTGFSLDVNFGIIGDFTQTFDKPTKISPVCQSGGGGQILQDLFNGKLKLLANAPPVVSGVTQPSSVNVGVAAGFSVVASDADADPLNYRITWGDSSSTALQTSAAFTHVFTSPGVFSAVAEIIDSRGSKVMQPFTVSVN